MAEVEKNCEIVGIMLFFLFYLKDFFLIYFHFLGKTYNMFWLDISRLLYNAAAALCNSAVA